ncbi:7861_t:CDS:2 [Entrophospora sp. SA101]|nr:7861_t:CDS:2 [Entrophospora sp. SA101]
MPRLNHNHKIFYNHLDQYYHNSSLSIFPNEILSLIFLNLDIGDLLMVCSVSKRFKDIGTLCFVKRLKAKSPATFNKNGNNCIGLLLSFEQEHRLRYNLEFEFESYDELSGNFKFKPKPTPSNNKKTIRFIQSSMVKNPSLYRVVLFGCSKLNLKRHHHHNNVTPTPNSHIATNLINNHNDHQHDFLSKSMSMPIKSQNERFTKTQHAYRMGDGINHLKVPYKFTYSISETPPPSMVKTRSGERWIVPESFEYDEVMIRQARLRNEMPREYLLKMKRLIMSPLESTRRTRGAR